MVDKYNIKLLKIMDAFDHILEGNASCFLVLFVLVKPMHISFVSSSLKIGTALKNRIYTTVRLNCLVHYDNEFYVYD